MDDRRNLFARLKAHRVSSILCLITGTYGVLHELMNTCQDHLSERRSLTNTRGGEYGSALQVASWGGHDKVVRCTLGSHILKHPIYDADSGKRRVAGS